MPSRLARARGARASLESLIRRIKEPKVRREAQRLASRCRSAALRLRHFLQLKFVKPSDIGTHCSKDIVRPMLEDRSVRGKAVGKARLALRLTIKSVWDFPEMQHRQLIPSDKERVKTIDELDRIVHSAKEILGAVKAG